MSTKNTPSQNPNETKNRVLNRESLVAAQCRATLRGDWRAERKYEARIMALDAAEDALK